MTYLISKLGSESKKLVIQAKHMYEENVATNCKNNAKSFFNSINNKKETRIGIGPLMTVQVTY